MPEDDDERRAPDSPPAPSRAESPSCWELIQFATQLILAIATIAIAVVAYQTATEQTELSLRTAAVLQFADVRPVPILWGDEEVECENGELRFGLVLVNYGDGPAILRSVVALINRDGAEATFEFTPEDLSLQGLQAAGSLEGGLGGIETTEFLRRDRLLAAGSCVILRRHSTLSGDEPDADWRDKHVQFTRGLRVVVEFDSAAGPTCVSDSRFGGAPACTWNGEPFP